MNHQRTVRKALQPRNAKKRTKNPNGAHTNKIGGVKSLLTAAAEMNTRIWMVTRKMKMKVGN